MSDRIIEEPCLVQSGQGFSVLYRDRYLYSRYSPQSSIQKTISSLQLQSGTLFLCYSPLLGYGLDLLMKVLPEDSFILCIECSDQLYSFSRSYIQELSISFSPDRFKYIFLDDTYTFAQFFSHKSAVFPDYGLFRRCVSIDFSGGTQFYTSFYRSITAYADDAVAQYWKNRITLTKMGRLYARNFFRNLAYVSTGSVLQEKCIDRPIFVFGAGASIDDVLPVVASEADRFFIICVDSALNPLLSRGIVPDAVAAVESQLANEKAFIGAVRSGIPILADITSRPHITRLTGGPVSFFLSEYAGCFFLDKVKERSLVPLCIPPLGSVGLTAVDIALHLRAEGVPVFFAGLDFCFKPGMTHCKEAPAHRSMLDSCNRFYPPGSPDAAFRQGSFSVFTRKGTPSRSDTALSGYAAHFSARFAMTDGLYAVSDTGMDLGSPYIPAEQMVELVKKYSREKYSSCVYSEKPTADEVKKINTAVYAFYKEEKQALEKLRDGLSNGSICADDLKQLMHAREYLYLHFPDAHLGFSTSSSFLKRIKTETVFFLKDIDIALQYLEKIIPLLS